MKQDVSEAKQQQFLILRGAYRKSLESIASDLEISKQTAVNWNVRFKDELNNLRQMSLESVLEKCHLVKVDRLHQLADLYNRIHQEIGKRDLAEVSTSSLFRMLFDVREKMLQEAGEIDLVSDVPTSLDDDLDSMLNPKKRVKVSL